MTAYADDATLQRAKVTEPFGYILKPFEERTLHSTIEMALYKHQLEQQRTEFLAVLSHDIRNPRFKQTNQIELPFADNCTVGLN